LQLRPFVLSPSSELVESPQFSFVLEHRDRTAQPSVFIGSLCKQSKESGYSINTKLHLEYVGLLLVLGSLLMSIQFESIEAVVYQCELPQFSSPVSLLHRAVKLFPTAYEFAEQQSQVLMLSH